MICVICGYEILGFGNNALPVKVGQCCDACNLISALFMNIPTRYKLGKGKNREETNE